MGNGGYSIRIGLVDSFFVFSLKVILFIYVFPGQYIVPFRGHLFNGLSHGTNSGNLVPTTPVVVLKAVSSGLGLSISRVRLG